MSKEADELEKLAKKVEEEKFCHKKAEKKEKEKKDPRDEKISKLETENAELTETLQRLQAEFENYKKRSEKENTQFREYAKAELVKELLPVIDSFDLAMKSRQNKEEFAKGIEMIHKEMVSLLDKQGLRKIEAIGKKFDPYKHDVLLSEESEKDEDVVLEELQRGYMFKDKVLRHTKVKVSKGKKGEQK